MSQKPPIDVALLAPLCIDEIVEPSGVRTRIGGVGFYASWALANRGCRVRLHTPLADRDTDRLAALSDRVEVIRHPSRSTTRFRIEIDPGRPNQRRMSLVEACDPLDPDAIGDLDAVAYVLAGPLLPGDLGSDLCAFLRAVSRPVDLGVQGLVRCIASDGSVSLGPPSALNLPPIRILAGDEAEVTTLAGTEDSSSAVDRLLAGGVEEVVVTRGDRGAMIARGATAERIDVPPVLPRRAVRHAIGLGDTFLAVYGWERHAGVSPSDAGAFAARAATRVMEEGCLESET